MADHSRDSWSEHVTAELRPPLLSADSFVATLKESSGLRRLLEVITPDGIYFVEYDGNGLGYETVRVNGREVESQLSMLWFIPRFDFALGRRSAVIEVRVWVWLRIRSFRLSVDGVVVFEKE